MTADERARMRDRLRTAVGRARLPGAELSHPGVFVRPAVPPDERIERFRRELTTLGGTVHEAATAADVVSIVRAAVGEAPAPHVLAWNDDELPMAGVHVALAAAGLSVVTQSPDQARSDRHRRTLASAAVGLTGADAGLAETGSLVLASGPGRGRLASLLPPIHVALLRRSLISGSLPELIADRPALVTSGANFVCITGPSRTADIEHVLARGVHGPRDVHVILLDD
jgi:L-lactate dehydrogenase complex protein LldG